MKEMRAGSVQFNHVPGDKGANLRRIGLFTQQAASRGVRLLVFPEMCITGYWHVRKLSRGDIQALADVLCSG